MSLQVSDIHRKKGDYVYEKGEKPYTEGQSSADYNAGLPVVAFSLSDEFKRKYPHVKQVSVSNLLRAKQYIIPSMTCTDLSVMPSPLTWYRLSTAAKRRKDRDSPSGCPRVHVYGPA